MNSRRLFLSKAAAAGLVSLCGRIAVGDELPEGVARVAAAFLNEALPEGGVDKAKSLWMKPGRGSAVGSRMFQADNDPRYLRFLVEVLYRLTQLTGDKRYRQVADGHVRYMATTITDKHPTWAIGNALEVLGVHHQFCGKEGASHVESARRLVSALRARRVQVTTVEGVKYQHFPCGYGVLGAKDAGWTNDLSMVGSGLLHAYELTSDQSIREDAISFAEYFVQPWRPNALGRDGYWQCGTWHEKLGSWVIGPSHYTGFESTDVFADEASWVFSTATCIDFLTRLHRHRPDVRFVDRCLQAAQWTFRECQFDDGLVGMCGRDDKWLGFTGDAITQVAQLRPLLTDKAAVRSDLERSAKHAFRALEAGLRQAKLENHGVLWVNRKSSTDPLVNVAMLWASALLGWLNGR